MLSEFPTKHANCSPVTFVTLKQFAVLFFPPPCCANSVLFYIYWTDELLHCPQLKIFYWWCCLVVSKRVHGREKRSGSLKSLSSNFMPLGCITDILFNHNQWHLRSSTEILVLGPQQTQQITGTRNAFQISFHPDWQIDNGFFNRPTMAHGKILVHRLGPRTRIWVLFRGADLTRV